MDIIFASQNEAHYARWIPALRDALPEARIHRWRDTGAPCGARAAVVWKPAAELFLREPGIEVVFNTGAGVDALFALPGMHEGIQIVRVEDAGMAVQMAEYALHFLVRAARGFDGYEQLQHDAQWTRLPDIDRAAWPVGVLGMGVMGERIARAVAALDYPVAGWSRRGRAVPGIRVYGGIDSLPDFLAHTRCLVNALPLTPETEGLLCRATLSRLIPGAYLINIARGGHLVEDDLLSLLESGHILGAALDVFHEEPLPPAHPFWSHPRIAVTPHIAAVSLLDETVEQIASKIRAYSRGETLSGVVDPRLRY